jgi:YHS domain-containing protein
LYRCGVRKDIMRDPICGMTVDEKTVEFKSDADPHRYGHAKE